MLNALKCPQHSSQVRRRKLSRSASVALPGISRCIQYSGRRYPSTRMWNNLVFILRDFGELVAAVAREAARALQVSRCLVMPALLNSAWQKLHFPFDDILGIFVLLTAVGKDNEKWDMIAA